MLCSNCKQHEATIHLTQVVGSEVKKLHLCEGCAAQSGLNTQVPVSLTDVLLGLGTPAGEEAPDTERACPRCHLRKSDFKKTGRLGCPACYETFAAELQPLLKSMHRSERHAGKVPARQRAALARSAERQDLRQQLEQAVAAEDYERAARLRDRLREFRATAGEEPGP